nr:hypothetical protein [Tanacetum cinerariifolium]
MAFLEGVFLFYLDDGSYARKTIGCTSSDTWGKGYLENFYLKSKTTEDIISNRSFMKVLVLNHYVFVKKVLIVLSIEDKLDYLEQPIPSAPVAPAGQHVAPEILAAHNAWLKGSKEIAGLMLMTMDLEIQRNLEPLHAHEMLRELKTLFAQQAEQELLQTTRDFQSCRQEEGQSVSSYVLKMKSYIYNLERLGHPITLGLGVSLILIGLRKEYDGFVQNYNMHSMRNTVNELHAMLKHHEQTLPKNNALSLNVIRAGKVQKGNKHQKSQSQKAARGQNHGKGKSKQAYAPKPKIPSPPKREDPAKDSICHECGEIGHWKRNCPQASRKLKPGALSLYVGNGQREPVEVIGAFYLCLPSGLEIVSNNCHYAPSITRGVISVFCLYEDSFVNRFVDNTIQVSRNNVVYFSAIPRDGILEIDLSNSLTNESSIYVVSNKRAKLDLDSTLLWHCRLGHISKKRIEKLQHDRLLDLSDLRAFKNVSLIMSRQGASYFITFTDDFSRYGYVYLSKHKHEVFETFKVFEKEVENQLGKTIRSLRSDRGGEYMSQDILDHLKDHRIITHRTPPYTPQHNRVSERRNRTLLDMVRSKMSQTTLPKSFWDYALNIATRILNMVPTKKRDTLTKPEKLEPRSIKCIFVGYPKETMGYSFYYPPENKVLVAWNAEFLKNSLINQEASGSLEDLEIIQEEDTHPSIDTSLNHEEDDLEIDEPQSDIVPIRRSTRTRHSPDHPESEKWLNAMNVEMQSMKDNDVWILVELPPNGKTIGSKWLFKKKAKMDGNVHTYKACLVAKGYTQTSGIDYKETFSPVADIRAVRILIAIAAYYDYEILQMDVKTAFLNGYLNEEVYMEQPKGEAAYILGIKIYRDRSRRLIGLCQSAYIEKILKRFCMKNSKRGSIPMQEKLKLSKSQGASTPSELKRMQNIPYASAVGSIMYAVRCTRPDVAFAQNVTSQFQQNPGDIYWTTVKKILKYLRNTKDMFLVYGGDLKRELRVSCYTDVGYMTDADDFKSQTGYVFVLNGGDVDWKSAKQSIFATSPAEAEYIAAFDASKEAVWVRKLIFRLGVVPTIDEPINIHFRAKVHYLREVIEYGDIKLEKVHTDHNLADPFTKALPFPKHSEHARNIGMLPASSLMIVLLIEDKLDYLEQPIPPALVAPVGQHVAPEILTAHNACIKGSKEIVGLMLMTMDPEIQQNLEPLHAHEMLRELKTLFSHMGKTVNKLHAMLKLHEQTLPKNNAPALNVILAGKVKKGNKHKKSQSQKAARGQNHGKGKNKQAYAPKPKIPPPPKREDPTKHSIYHESSGAGGSGIFVIELNTIINKSWIYDTSCGTHICNTTHGLRASRKLKPKALSLYVGNGQSKAVEAIGAFYLCLLSGLEIVLNNCHYAPSITRGVISVSCFAIPKDGIFEIDLSNSLTNESSIYAVSNKRAKLDLDSTLLWHCRLRHISKKRIEKLQHDGLLDSSDLRAFEKCVSFVQYSQKCEDSCQRILSSKSSFPQLQLGINLLHLAGSQPLLKFSYKAEASVIISIPSLVGGVADVLVEIKGTGWSISITFRFSVGLQTPDDLSRSRLGFIEKMDGLRASRKLKPRALSLYVGNGQSEAVEAIGAFYLCLPSGLEIVLNNCHYALSITRGVISISRLDGIFEIDLSNSLTNESSIYDVSNKRAKLDLDSTLLWHCRLGHISKKRIEKLQHDGLLDSSDLRAFEKCMYVAHLRSCQDKEQATSSPSLTTSADMVMFTCRETFKVFQKEVENQLGKTIKSLRSDRGGEYMSQEFLDHLKDHGIIAQRTPPYTPQHNGYPKETMGYSFYYPPENNVLVARNAEFLENSLINQKASGSLEDLEIIQEDTHPSIDTSLNHKEDDLEIDEPQSDIVPIHRSTKTRHAPDRMCLYINAEEHELGDLGEPANYKAAFKWLCKKKADMDRNVHTYKARLVANGYTKTPRIDYKETFSLVIDIRAVRILIAIAADRSRRLIGLCQSAYIEKILKRFCMKNSKRGSIPMQEKLKLSESQGDIHWTTVKNILKYLRNTKDMFLVYEGDLKRELRVSCYTDAGYLTDANDLKSQNGYVFVLNGGDVDWKSAKQSIFATSSAEAEYIVAFDGFKEVVWVRKSIFRLGVVPIIEEPISMYCDNTRAIAIANES